MARDIVADFLKTAIKQKTMRKYFEDSLYMNILNWKINRRTSFITTMSWRKTIFFKEITSLSSKHLLVSKRSWKRPQDMSWRHLQHAFSVTNSCLPRSPEDVLKTSWRRFEDVKILKKCLQDIFKTSKRQKKMGGYLTLTNLNVYVSNKSVFHKSISHESKANPKSFIRSQSFQYLSFFEIQAAFLF